jgi:hypothetical protein
MNILKKVVIIIFSILFLVVMYFAIGITYFIKKEDGEGKKDTEFTQMAVANRDVAICAKVSHSDSLGAGFPRNACFMKVLEEVRDISVCENAVFQEPGIGFDRLSCLSYIENLNRTDEENKSDIPN